MIYSSSFPNLGSEKVKESKATGDTLTETHNINKSLLALGMFRWAWN